MTILFVADIADTLIKGGAYLQALGLAYYARTALYILLSRMAIKVIDQRFHAAFAIFATAAEIALILKYSMTIV
jgi:hypothetical protein